MKDEIRIILDTNLWISFLISKRLIHLDKLLESDRIVLIFSEESMEEFLEVAKRPKFQKYFSLEDIEALIHLFDYYGELIEVVSEIDVCRDSKDNFLLALAKDGQVNFLVTGDKDLLILEMFLKTQIITYGKFIESVLN